MVFGPEVVVVSRGEAWVRLEGGKVMAISMVLLLEMARCIVVAVHRAGRNWSRMCKVALMIRVTQGTRLGVTLLAEAWLVRGDQPGAVCIDASVCTLFAARVKASVLFRAVRTGASHSTVWLATRVEIALLAKLLEAVVGELAVDVDVGFGGKAVVLAYPLGGGPAFSST